MNKSKGFADPHYPLYYSSTYALPHQGMILSVTRIIELLSLWKVEMRLNIKS
ncbi:hypothetical protein K491DRAFT_686664 [Lophiostoma macrostomum CBS 122681]|uniref:Uncharacterized protein n=1 Tax=Lophiostoma macrostomum CBS 122681 TaxID=1314788 RepID=A0A6A6TT95_9PLEO|nr:hypothetical protein K491DRAFT_686664 [Lophiostoma macrostomum CBS 122681]